MSKIDEIKRWANVHKEQLAFLAFCAGCGFVIRSSMKIGLRVGYDRGYLDGYLNGSEKNPITNTEWIYKLMDAHQSGLISIEALKTLAPEGVEFGEF